MTVSSSRRPAGSPTSSEGGERPIARSRDLVPVVAALVLFAATAVVGGFIQRADGTLGTSWPPLLAHWMPHVGPGTPAAVAAAVLLVAYGPAVAARLPWRALLASAWAAALVWTFSLALIDGWQRGIAGRLTTRHEYVPAVPRFHDILPTLQTFSQHIVGGHPGYWPAHVAGHPPGAVLTFVLLDRLGLGGGAWAGVFCIVAGTSVAVAALVTLRCLCSESTARRAAPFLVLTPGAIWVGASADGYFACVAAWALALLALAATRRVRAPVAAALGSGLLFGLAVHVSYGLTLIALPGLAVLLAARNLRPLPYVLGAVAAVVAVFAVLGFRWWDAYPLLVERYDQGLGGVRPYSYWLFGDLATAVASAGLASVAGMGRVLRFPLRRHRGLVLLCCAFLLAIVAADLSGMSKAETERIWLPFTLWLPASAALLPRGDHRGWLAAQACAALLINHLLLTGW
ncbi:hypothetical protein [Streptomyces montanisoli]|uniref:Integral membrane protein n=1 Tax=Streptomyces montanisoli TaxID=2798581 RepID=A0A940RXM1_9ACTN|nr:hypothetical protein [Streptomyces montanisoli]